MNLRIDIPKEPETPAANLRRLLGNITPRSIYQELDKSIKGNEDLKKSYSVALYNHFKRFITRNDKDFTPAPRNNMLFLGPTGCGKTFMAQTGAKLLGLPCHTIDCASLVPSGIKGLRLSQDLPTLAGIPNHGFTIVILDEFDKLGTHLDNDLQYNSQVQSELLRVLEGTVMCNEENGKSIDTSNMLFILTGAFSSITKEEERPVKAMGFKPSITHDYNTQKLLDKIVGEGFLPELMGRISFVGRILPMTTQTVLEILDSKDSELTRYINALSDEGLEVAITDDAKEVFAKRVLTLQTGARAVKTILDHLFLDVQFNQIGGSENSVIEVTKEMIESLPIGYTEVKDTSKAGF